jgi:FixJ family two-component response regulator
MGKTEEAVNVATVYVVDDDDGMRRALNLLLNTVGGYNTAAFASPKKFLDKF